LKKKGLKNMQAPSARNLAMRDPAMAAAMGVFSGSDFGARNQRPRLTRRRPQPAPVADFGFGFGDDYGFGDEFSFGQAAPAAPAPPAAPTGGGVHPSHPAHPHHPMHAKHQHIMQHNTQRELMLDPNKYSKLKVQGYMFSLVQVLALNTALAFNNVTLSPSAKIHPKRMVTNITFPAMVFLASVQVANVAVIIGSAEDAFSYGPDSFGLVTEFPTLDTSLRATMSGNYTGFVPPGYANGFAYNFTLTFQGPAALAGNG
jgi:hypothetical protein